MHELHLHSQQKHRSMVTRRIWREQTNVTGVLPLPCNRHSHSQSASFFCALLRSPRQLGLLQCRFSAYNDALNFSSSGYRGGSNCHTQDMFTSCISNFYIHTLAGLRNSAGIWMTGHLDSNLCPKHIKTRLGVSSTEKSSGLPLKTDSQQIQESQKDAFLDSGA